MSLIREEKLHPVQHFNMHDDPLTHIETLHLLIWSQGLCIAGYGLSGNILTTKVYTFAAHDIHAIESVFMNEPLVAGPQPVTHIWMAEERNMVIPQHLFNEEAAALWLGKFHPIAAHETVHTTTLKHGVSIAYPVFNDLNAVLKKYFKEAAINTLSGVLLQQEISYEHDVLDLVFLNETIAFTIRKKGKLIAHQTEIVTDINNLIYKIASISQEHDIVQEDLKVSVSGFCIKENIIQELKQFYPKMIVPGSEQFSSFTLLSKLISCAL